MANRDEKGYFKKGVSGNPGGRPKEFEELKSLAREHTREAIETIVAVMRDQLADKATRVTAADKLLDRGWGKPAQAMTGEGGEGAVMHEVVMRIIDPAHGNKP